MPPAKMPTPSPKPWALGWLIDTKYFVELARYLDLYDGSPDNWVELMGAGIDHVLAETSWPNFMECTVGGNTEFVFAMYVDYKRRPLPPHIVPRSQLLSPKYTKRLDAWVPLNGDPRWFPCTDGSFTPWRYANAQPGEDEDWVDVSYCPLFPQVERDLADELGDVKLADYADELGLGESEDDQDEDYDDVDEDGNSMEENHCTEDTEVAAVAGSDPGGNAKLLEIPVPIAQHNMLTRTRPQRHLRKCCPRHSVGTTFDTSR